MTSSRIFWICLIVTIGLLDRNPAFSVPAPLGFDPEDEYNEIDATDPKDYESEKKDPTFKLEDEQMDYNGGYERKSFDHSDESDHSSEERDESKDDDIHSKDDKDHSDESDHSSEEKDNIHSKEDDESDEDDDKSKEDDMSGEEDDSKDDDVSHDNSKDDSSSEEDYTFGHILHDMKGKPKPMESEKGKSHPEEIAMEGKFDTDVLDGEEEVIDDEEKKEPEIEEKEHGDERDLEKDDDLKEMDEEILEVPGDEKDEEPLEVPGDEKDEEPLEGKIDSKKTETEEDTSIHEDKIDEITEKKQRENFFKKMYEKTKNYLKKLG